MSMNFKNVLGHIGFWVIIMLAYALSEFGYTNNFQTALLYEIAYLPSRILAVYINWFVLIPRLLYHNRILSYLTLLGICLVILAVAQRYFLIEYVNPILFPEWKEGTTSDRLLFRIFQSIVVIASPVAFSTGIKIFIDWYRQRTREKKLEKEKIETELKYLRSQINPHFLFNTLNNLYGLSMEKSKQVPDLILKLSDFLSYSLYETQGNSETSLQKEMDLVEDYIQLETARYPERVKVNWIKECPEAKIIKVPSFVFIPLVENAFKHGVKDEVNYSEINIYTICNPTGIVFSINNTIAHETDEEPGGIGLQNLRRRLDLLIPEKYDLQTRKVNKKYFAELKLKI